MLRTLGPIIALAILLPAIATADVKRGQFTYGTEHGCVADGALTPALCNNAAANAQAEFDEKAPRFSDRGECESEFGKGRCSLGFSGAAGWAGKKSGIYFTPRLSGFRMLVSSEQNIVVVPFVAGRIIGFSPRTALRKATTIDFRTARQAREAWRSRSTSSEKAESADAVADAPADNARPAPRLPAPDPNFDCAAVLEAGADPTTACYPAPRRP